MDTLFQAIYLFFQEHLFPSGVGDEIDLIDLRYAVGNSITENGMAPFYMTLQEWLCYTATFITIITLFVLCCLFIYKIVRLIGGLIR